MKKIDLFYLKFQNDPEIRESFAEAFATGNLIFFFETMGLDPKLSEFSDFLKKVEENDSEYFSELVTESYEDPSFDIPEEQWNEMISPFQENTVPPPEYLINYNEKFKCSQPILFRNEVIQQILSCLILQYKPNVLLIGAAGVGKTKVIEEISCLLAENLPSIPPQLRGYTIWELPLSALVAGSNLVGETERKTRAVIEFASDPINKVILFIDEIHMLIRGDRSYDTIAQMLKPVLARGIIKVIGATTLQESNDIMKDPAFCRRYNRIYVDELTKKQTRAVLMEMSQSLSEHYYGKIVIGRKVIDEAIEVADKYKTAGSHRPDNVITLIDRAMAEEYVRTSGRTRNPIRLTAKDIHRTAIKLSNYKKNDNGVDFESLRKHLVEIKGQDAVIECLIDFIKRDSLNLFSRTKPLTLLFAGYSGVGKSKMAKILARELTGSPPIILNMTEFTEQSSLSRIVGVHAGYAGCDSKAELPFDDLESSPYQIILLDEFEKCHKSVQRLFMQVFDAGIMQLANNKTVNFSQSIIIATSNCGFATINNTIGFTNDETSSPSVIDLSHSFDIELLNRFTKILYFKPISEQLYRDILRDRYEREVSEIKQHGKADNRLPDTLTDDVLDRLVHESYNPAFGARPASRAIRAYIETLLINEHDNINIMENKS